jgi:hypothetical protein
MKRLLYPIAGSMLALAGSLILGATAPAHTETLVQLDYGWRTDAEASCTNAKLHIQPWRSWACTDPIGDFEAFAKRIDTIIASTSSCQGITFIRFPWGPTDPAVAATLLNRHSHWLFFLYPYYIVGQMSQSWRLATPQAKDYFNGKGNSEKIVADICMIITSRGGTVIK